MPVPIPINECTVLASGRLLWGTSHTPFGPARPCVGQIEFAGWRREGTAGVFELLDPHDHVVATLVPYAALPLTVSRATRLREDQSRHQRRAATDPAYASRWARQFREAHHAGLAPA